MRSSSGGESVLGRVTQGRFGENDKVEIISNEPARLTPCPTPAPTFAAPRPCQRTLAPASGRCWHPTGAGSLSEVAGGAFGRQRGDARRLGRPPRPRRASPTRGRRPPSFQLARMAATSSTPSSSTGAASSCVKRCRMSECGTCRCSPPRSTCPPGCECPPPPPPLPYPCTPPAPHPLQSRTSILRPARAGVAACVARRQRGGVRRGRGVRTGDPPRVLGRRRRVEGYLNDCWWPGEVVEQHPKKGLRLSFDDGDSAWLGRRNVRPATASTASTAAAAFDIATATTIAAAAATSASAALAVRTTAAAAPTCSARRRRGRRGGERDCWPRLLRRPRRVRAGLLPAPQVRPMLRCAPKRLHGTDVWQVPAAAQLPPPQRPAHPPIRLPRGVPSHEARTAPAAAPPPQPPPPRHFVVTPPRPPLPPHPSTHPPPRHCAPPRAAEEPHMRSRTCGAGCRRAESAARRGGGQGPRSLRHHPRRARGEA